MFTNRKNKHLRPLFRAHLRAHPRVHLRAHLRAILRAHLCANLRAHRRAHFCAHLRALPFPLSPLCRCKALATYFSCQPMLTTCFANKFPLEQMLTDVIVLTEMIPSSLMMNS